MAFTNILGNYNIGLSHLISNNLNGENADLAFIIFANTTSESYKQNRAGSHSEGQLSILGT